MVQISLFIVAWVRRQHILVHVYSHGYTKTTELRLRPKRGCFWCSSGTPVFNRGVMNELHALEEATAYHNQTTRHVRARKNVWLSFKLNAIQLGLYWLCSNECMTARNLLREKHCYIYLLLMCRSSSHIGTINAARNTLITEVAIFLVLNKKADYSGQLICAASTVRAVGVLSREALRSRRRQPIKSAPVPLSDNHQPPNLVSTIAE